MTPTNVIFSFVGVFYLMQVRFIIFRK